MKRKVVAGREASVVSGVSTEPLRFCRRDGLDPI